MAQRTQLAKTLLDKRWLGARLRALRERYFERAKDTDLTGLQYVEEGQAFPSWPTLVHLSYKCGLRVADLLEQLEPATSERETKKSSMISVRRENRHVHEQLEALLTSRDTVMATAIATNITVFYEAFVAQRRKPRH